MTTEWGRQAVLEAVRTRLLRPGAVTTGYSAVDVVAEPDAMSVTFRWRRDPTVYAVEVGFPAAPKSPWTGLPVTSVEEWAADVESLLMEELDTGLVRRSRRTVREGYVLLDTGDAPDPWPAGFSISPVPYGDDVVLSVREGAYAIRRSRSASRSPHAAEPGSWLAEAGMDVTIPRQLIAEARLACWLQAYADNARGEPHVGHAAASWEDERHTIARLDVAHILPGVPSEVRQALMRVAVREVVEAGAVRVVTAIGDPELRGLGFRPANDGGLVLHAGSTEPPEDPAAEAGRANGGEDP
ncbi:hypothetical protein [Nonomuraea rhodomycinica]|uniref:Uncharacterized protein n=1 Tax=Nonomuraea rhodomycinica TaxID=1712872 RepID=A0A7Y6MBF7_9ACTN|nr:hypothetical protein [Nonomuraea rhodomycinica]NUW40429.1 hypothetical protein [Nonomuraea rhodomycinica]